jgi:hypothetical protein
MKILSREAINRMVGNSRSAQGSQFSRGGGGGGGQAVSLANLSDVSISTPIDGGSVLTFDETAGKWVAGPDVFTTMWDALSATGTEQIDASHLTGVLGDYATETWVSQNYISIAFFSRLFQAHGTENNQQTDIDPNDTDSTITSIEAMFGFWTEQYLSALGNSGGGSVSLTLANMGDVSLNNLADGQVLTYNATTGKWINANPQGGVTDLASLTDVTLTPPSANQVLLYDGTTSKWINSALKTINGQPLYGTGNIEVGGGASGNYLPLSGGTLTGPLDLARDVDIRSGGYTLLVYRPSNQQTVSRSQWGVGTINIQGVIRSDASDLLHWRGGGTSGQAYAILDEYNATTILNNSYLPLAGGTLSGRLTIDAGVLNITGETGYAQGIRIHDSGGYSSIFFRCTAATGNNNGMWGLTAYSSGLGIRGTSSTSSSTLNYYLSIAYGGNVGIGTTSPNYKLHVNGTLGAGNTSVANLESEGYVSALSDIRKKEVVEYMDGLTIEQIASMPIIKFTWKDRPEEGLQVGSVAQEWQKILPQSVHTTHDGFLSFAESRAALVGTISNSRKLVEHEERIAELERENKELKLKLNIA